MIYFNFYTEYHLINNSSSNMNDNDEDCRMSIVSNNSEKEITSKNEIFNLQYLLRDQV